MIGIFIKNILTYFRSIYRILSLSVMLVILNLFMWVLPDTSIINVGFADLSQLFMTMPYILMILIPTITMNLITEDKNQKTLELILTRPVRPSSIWFGNYFFVIVTIFTFFILTSTNYLSISLLKSQKSLIDHGHIWASYTGMVFISIAFASISLFYSTITARPVVAFLLSLLSCYFLYELPDLMANLPFFKNIGISDFLNYLSFRFHFINVGKGLIGINTVLYVTSFVALFTYLGIKQIESVET